MIRKSGNRFSEKIMLKQRDEIMIRFSQIGSWLVGECLDHFGPFHNIAAQEFIELFRRHRHRRRALIGPEVDDLRPFDGDVDGGAHSSMMGFGVPVGAINPSQMVASYPGRPAVRRSAPSGSTWSAFRRWWRAPAPGPDARGADWPSPHIDHHLHLSADDAVARLAAVAVGTCTRSMPAMVSNSSPAM